MSQQLTSFYILPICLVAIAAFCGCNRTESREQHSALQELSSEPTNPIRELSDEPVSTAVAAIQLVSASEEVDEAESADQPLPAKSGPITDEATLSEIQEIRRSVGISVLPLTGDLKDDSFMRALRSVAQTAVPSFRSVPNEFNEPGDVASQSKNAATLSDEDRQFALNIQTVIDALQARAEQAEANRNYLAADRMRQSAQILRLEIRSLYQQ